MPGGGGGGSPVSALSSPLSSLGGLASNMGSSPSPAGQPGSSAPMLPPGSQGSERGRNAAQKALSKLGARYVWGAEGPDVFDCSGLTEWAYKNAAGEALPRTTYDQVKLGLRVNPADAQPGDLVFSNFSGRGPEHVQMAIGDGKVVHAPQPGDVVKISNMPSNVIVKRIL